MEIILLDRNGFSESLDGICALYSRAFTGTVSPDTLSHRFLDNPSGDLLASVAVDNGKIVAYFGALPSQVNAYGRISKASLSVHAMTDPEYGGRGIFNLLTEKLYERIAEVGIEYAYVFPNLLSHPTFIRKREMHDVYEFPALTLELSPDTAAPTCTAKEGINRSAYCHDENHITIEKSPEYLNWRYYSAPGGIYSMLSLDDRNWLIYKFFEDKLNVCELHFESKDALEELIASVISKAVENKKSCITLWISVYEQYHVLLEKMGFRNRYPITYFGVTLVGASCDERALDPREWRIQMGDDNVY
ncbi:MAG: GNAT family N-acetyltransferase [Firmicutes bacterium]|nr:GNAT family N-acetyltransferase [Bacillota bacterium]